MKLWSAIFVICLLASTAQGVFAVQEPGTGSYSGIISEAPLNPEFIAYNNAFTPIEWLKNILSQEKLGYIPEPADTTHLKGKKISKKALEAEVQGISDVPSGDTGEIVSAPAMYDLRDLGRVSPVKNQGSCGSCWAFASYGSLESEALPGQMFDFSENNLKNAHGFDKAPCSGGNSQMATAYLTRWSGAVAEADDPYVGTSTTSPTGLPVQVHAQEILMIPGRSGPLDNDNIKAALQTTGALYTTMYWSNTYYNAVSKAYYYSGATGSNHGVTIVGWDDNYSRTNFLTAPPGDGAFIIKNSWGTSWGNNGYFYMSYYDANVGKSLTTFTGESVTNYAHIYQFDPLGWISSIGYGSDTGWAANVFTATSQETISAVGLSTNQVNTAYQIFIYTNPTQGPISTADPVYTAQGTIGIPGYHTVSLLTPVTINAGQKFSVVVRFQTPNYNYPITFERPISGYTSKAAASAGQSYISSTGTTWTDLTATAANSNVCLKAYTVNTGISAAVIPTAIFSTNVTYGTTPLSVKFTDQSTGTAPMTWAWDFNNDGITDSNLQHPAKVYSTVGIYTAKLTVSNSAGSKSATKAITVTSPPTPTPTVTPTPTPTIVLPAAQFSASATSGVAPIEITFTDHSVTTGTTTYYWKFINSAGTVTSTSTAKNPVITYSTSGYKTISLTVTDSVGSDTELKTNYISISGTTPTPSPTPTPTPTLTPTPSPSPVLLKASFTATPLNGQLPLVVTFTDTSIGNPTKWAWDFENDGIIDSTEPSPSHTFTSAAVYTVKLTVENANGSSQVVKKNYIRVQVSKAQTNKGVQR